jgi:hypothetical protein
MGMLKRMKDMKDMVNAAPGMVAQAQQLGAQAQQMAAAQQAAGQAQMAQAGAFQPGGAVATGPDFDPVAGVTLGQFAAVSKGVAAYNYDQAKLPEIALGKGIDPVSWQSAAQAWNERIKANPAVAQRFNQLYRES